MQRVDDDLYGTQHEIGQDYTPEDINGMLEDLEYLRSLEEVDEPSEEEEDESRRQAKLSQPLYPGASMTVKQYCYAMLREKRSGRIRDGVFDRLLHLQQSCLLPQNNLAPKSLFRMKTLLGIATAQNYEWHVCNKGCCSFPPLPRKLWMQSRNEKVQYFTNPIASVHYIPLIQAA